MTIYGLAISQRKPDLFFYTGVIEEHTRPVNHFSEVPDVRLPQQRHNTLRIDHRAGGIESSRRNTARRAEKKFEGHLLAIFDHILHTLNSQHVTDLMRIRHCGYSAMNDGHPGKFGRHKHGAFNVNVCVNETREYELVLGVHLFVDGNDHAVAYFDFSGIDRATLNVDNLTRYLHEGDCGACTVLRWFPLGAEQSMDFPSSNPRRVRSLSYRVADDRTEQHRI